VTGQAPSAAATEHSDNGHAGADAEAEIRQEIDANRDASRADKLKLPPKPAPEDKLGQCRWLSRVFPLHRDHPIIDGRRGGASGHSGHVELPRRGVAPIRFEPASRINTPLKLIETLSWELQPIDGPVPKFTGEHCAQIAHVIRMLCTINHAITAEQETAGIVDTFLQVAQPVTDRTTYGTSRQRYEAALGLRREVEPATGWPIGPPRYLIEPDTGELVIGVSDLQDSTRRTTGTSHSHGWLDGRMETALGWERIRLEGYELDGRAGRREGRHLRVYAYRGVLPEGPVNT
jgi:hypothetical protein